MIQMAIVLLPAISFYCTKASSILLYCNGEPSVFFIHVRSRLITSDLEKMFRSASLHGFLSLFKEHDRRGRTG